jgi:glycosyltransferase involved in cell wall biosynthesis
MYKPVTKVLIVIPTLTAGGAERVVLILARHLSRAMFHVELAVLNMHGAAFQDQVPHDITLHDLQCTRVRKSIPKLLRLIYNRRPDVVLSTLGHLNFALALVAPALPVRTKLIARETSMPSATIVDPVRPDWWWHAYRSLYRRLITRFALVISQSEAMRDDLVEVFHLPEDKIKVIHNPVDLKTIDALLAGEDRSSGGLAGRGGLRLVAAGRLVSVKGFDLLIRALALCVREDIHVTILGTGPMEMELRALAKSVGVQSRVCFAGHQQNPYLFFAKADAFVLSSHSDAFPNAALEALACGTPVIATPASGGIAEILFGIDSCLIADEISAEALAKAFAAFVKGRVPRSAVERFDTTRIIPEFQAVLRRNGTH